jgi:hypothetical protein
LKTVLRSLRFPKSITLKSSQFDAKFVSEAVLSFFLGRTVLAGSLAPFGVGLYSGVRMVNPGWQSTILGVSSLLGICSLRNWELLGYHALCMLLVTLLVKTDELESRYPKILDYLMVGSIVALSRATVTAVLTPSLYGYLSAGLEGMCAVVVALLASSAFSPEKKTESNSRDIEAKIVLSVMALGGLYGIGLAGISLQNILAMSATLAAGFVVGPSVGAIAGLSGGMILALTGSEEPVIIGLLGIAGLLAGVGGWFGKTEAILGFVSAGLLMSLYGSSGSLIGYRMVEQILSCIPIIFITPNMAKKFSDQYPMFLKQPERIQRMSVDPIRLKAAAVSYALSEVGQLLDQVSATSSPMSSNVEGATSSSILVREVAERVCHECSKQEVCWEDNFSETFGAFNEFIRKANVAGLQVSREDDTGMSLWCQRFGEAVAEVKHLKELKRLERRIMTLDSETKECLAFQYRCLGRILADGTIKKEVDELDARPRFRISVSGKSLPAEGDSKTGDTWIRYDLSCRKTLIALVDGMGKGKVAANQSRQTVELMKSLLDCGLDFNSCVSFLNSALFLAFRPNSFVALDCLLVDQNTERAYFHKLGAPPSFIQKEDGTVLVVRGTRPPAGAFKTIPILATTEPIAAGDTIYLVSDGVFRSSPVPARAEHLFISRLKRLKDSTLDSSVRTLVGQAKRYRGQPSDDVTVVGVNIQTP